MKNIKYIIFSLFLLLSLYANKAEATVTLQLSALNITGVTSNGTSTLPTFNLNINTNDLSDFSSTAVFGINIFDTYNSSTQSLSGNVGSGAITVQTGIPQQTKTIAITQPLTNNSIYFARVFYTSGTNLDFIYSNTVSFKFGDATSVNNNFLSATAVIDPLSNGWNPVTLTPNTSGTESGQWWFKQTINGEAKGPFSKIDECETERAKGNSYSKQCFQYYYPLAPLPGQADKIDTTTSGDSDCPFGNYLNILIKLFIGICAVLAMIKIVLGGMQYMTSELSSGKEDGKNSITSAVFGLILALGAFAILNTINPELLKVCLNNLPKATVVVENEPETGIESDNTGKATINLIKKSDNSIVTLTNCDTTQMVTVNAFGTSMQVYKGLKPSIERINQQWLAHPANDRYKVKTVYAYNCRKVRNKSTAWSSHAFGLALDINPQENQYGNTLKTDMPSWFKQLFINEGWGWGGDWVNVKDAMHFSKYPASEGGDKKIEI